MADDVADDKNQPIPEGNRKPRPSTARTSRALKVTWVGPS